MEENNIVTFPHGLAGFEKIKRYCICANKEEAPFFQLQALDGSKLFFHIVNPLDILPTYNPKIDEQELGIIQNPPPDKTLLFSLVVVDNKDYTRSTVNLAAPIIINSLNRTGRQVVISNLKEYSSRHKILEKEGSEVCQESRELAKN